MKAVRTLLVAVLATVVALPLVWLVLTAFKHHPDAIAPNAKFLPLPGAEIGGAGRAFAPSVEGFAHLADVHEGMESSFLDHFWNSVIVGLSSIYWIAFTYLLVAFSAGCAALSGPITKTRRRSGCTPSSM